MRAEKIENLKTASKELMNELAEIEVQIASVGKERAREKEMRHLARLIYAGKMIEKVGLLYSFNEQTLCEILAANKNKITKPQ